MFRRPIEERVVTALGKHWHVEHFVCAKVSLSSHKNRQKDKKTNRQKDKVSLSSDIKAKGWMRS